MKNITAYMDRPQSIKFRKIPVPEPAKNEVVVKIECCGICGSDVHYYEHGKIGDYVVEGDFTLGHEIAGTVEKTGEAVHSLKVGDRVALEPGIPCGKCEQCKSGRYNLCKDVIFFATPPVQGALQNYVVHPDDMCFKLPDNMSALEGALVEPLCVGLHACAQGNVTVGNSVVIFGGGCIGLVTLMAAKARGAANVIVIDLFEKRLAYAKELGASHVIDASKADVEKELNKILGTDGADVVIETAGVPKTIYQTATVAKMGGNVVLVGIALDSTLPYNFASVMSKELTIRSVFRYRNLYPVAIAAIESGSIDIKRIVTNKFKFDKTKEAFDEVITNAENIVKAVIEFD